MTERTLPRGPAPARTRNGLALALVLGCQLMLMLDVTVMNVALPSIQAELGFSPANLSWVINAYALVFGGLLLLGGRAGDLFGRRRTFVFGVSLFTVASLAGGLADSAGMLLAARVLQGLGAAAAGPSTLALITSTFTEQRERVRALALFSGMSSGGFAIGLILGGLLTDWTSWRAVLFINVPVGVAIALLAPKFVPAPVRHRARLDVPGALTATAGMGSLVYGLIRAADHGWRDGGTLLALGAGVVLLAVFVTVELRTTEPLVPPRLFTDRNRVAAYANFFLGPMAMMSMFFFLTQFLQDVTGLAPLATGFAFLPMAAVLFGMSRLVPRLLPRFGPKPLALFGTVVMVAGLAWLTGLDADSGYFGALFGPMVLMGFGGGLAFAPLNVIIMATVPPSDAGAAGGVLQTMQQTGGTLGLAVLVTVFGSATRAAPPGTSAADVLVTGMTTAFSVAACFATLTVLVALSFRRVPTASGPR